MCLENGVLCYERDRGEVLSLEQCRVFVFVFTFINRLHGIFLPSILYSTRQSRYSRLVLTILYAKDVGVRESSAVIR